MNVSAEKSIFWLIVIRLIIGISILTSAVLIQVTSGTILPLTPLYLIVGVILFLSIFYLFFFLKKYSERFQIYLQLTTDIFLITSLIYLTGGIQSPFSFLYIITILTASILLSKRGILLISSLSIIIFGLLVDLMNLNIIPYYEPEGVYIETYSISRIYFIFFLNFLAFVITSMLSVYLSERAKKSYEELKEKREKLAQLKLLYQNVIESMASGLITLDIDGKVTFANTAACNILKNKNRDNLQANHFDEIFNKIITFEELKERVKEKVFYRMEGSIIEGDEKIEVGAVASTLRDISGNIMGYLVVFQDITNIKFLQERVRIKDRMAALGEMAAGMAHEIRNPLSAIKGAVQLLNSNTISANVKELSSILIKECNRLNRLIESFLNYAKPPPFNLIVMDLRSLIQEEIKRLYQYKILNNNIELKMESEEGKCYAMIDVEQFNQAIQNIIKNAVQAMPNGGSLKIAIRKDNNSWLVEFADSGIGIEPHRLKKIFDPFQHSTTGGTGLGMAIIYRIIKEHNGTVEVKSEVGRGTRIIIKLPRIDYRNIEN